MITATHRPNQGGSTATERAPVTRCVTCSGLTPVTSGCQCCLWRSAAGAIALHVRDILIVRPGAGFVLQSSAPMSLSKPYFAGWSRPFANLRWAPSWVESINHEVRASTVSSIEMTAQVACRFASREV